MPCGVTEQTLTHSNVKPVTNSLCPAAPHQPGEQRYRELYKNSGWKQLMGFLLLAFLRQKYCQTKPGMQKSLFTQTWLYALWQVSFSCWPVMQIRKKKKPPNIVKARLILVLWSSPNHCQYKVDTLCAAMVIWKTFLSDIYMVHWRFTLHDRVKFYFPVLKRVLREWAEQLGNESDFLTYVLWRRNTQGNNFLVSFLRI